MKRWWNYAHKKPNNNLHPHKQNKNHPHLDMSKNLSNKDNPCSIDNKHQYTISIRDSSCLHWTNIMTGSIKITRDSWKEQRDKSNNFKISWDKAGRLARAENKINIIPYLPLSKDQTIIITRSTDSLRKMKKLKNILCQRRTNVKIPTKKEQSLCKNLHNIDSSIQLDNPNIVIVIRGQMISKNKKKLETTRVTQDILKVHKRSDL